MTLDHYKEISYNINKLRRCSNTALTLIKTQTFREAQVMTNQQSTIINPLGQEIQYGYCQCGCGQKTKLSLKNDSSSGRIKGKPMRYLRGHNRKYWKGGRTITGKGYVMVSEPNHPRVNRGGYVLEHILIAEKALGEYLPPNAIVHHINGIKNDNSPENLLICQDEYYHKLLHIRKQAYDACGNVNYRKCTYCKKYDAIEKMENGGHSSYIHPHCRRVSVNARNRAKKQ